VTAKVSHRLARYSNPAFRRCAVITGNVVNAGSNKKRLGTASYEKDLLFGEKGLTACASRGMIVSE
jgi:hypothetical protein